MFQWYFWEVVGAVISLSALIYLMVKNCLPIAVFKKIRGISKKNFIAGLIFLAGILTALYASIPYPLHFAMPPLLHSMAPGELPSSIPIPNLFKILFNPGRFEAVDNIGADPNLVPVLKSEINDQEPVKFELTASEVYGEISKGIYFNYWTYNNQVPGPMLRVREGQMVEISLTNDTSSLHPHNIDLHSVTGPGGGATVTKVMPGETRRFRWKALNPGLYVYHCATPNVSTHNSHGQYGLILVEPKEGLPSVDKEFYVMQGELYTRGSIGRKGLAVFDSEALLDGNPNYVTFNGVVEEAPRMKARTGEKIRMYVGNGGVNLISSFHIIGEIFDVVYPEAAIGSPPLHNVQTTAVLPGGATIVEFTLEVPGKYILVDHALARMNKGAWAILEVEGEERKDVFEGM